MKQSGVGEHAIEPALRQIELEEILLPHLAAALIACHRRKACGAFQADRNMIECREYLEVTPRPAAEIEDSEGRPALDGLQQRGNVLADVVIASAFPERFGALVVVVEREGRCSCQFFAIQFHVRPVDDLPGTRGAARKMALALCFIRLLHYSLATL